MEADVETALSLVFTSDSVWQIFKSPLGSLPFGSLFKLSSRLFFTFHLPALNFSFGKQSNELIAFLPFSLSVYPSVS